MSEIRRGLMMQNNTTPGPYDPSLIFWAPMDYGDLTDHVSGIEMQLTGYGSIEWDNSLGIYKITTPSSTYNTVLSFHNIVPWKDLIPNSFTVCAKLCRFRNSYGTANKCRVFSMGHEGGDTEENSYGFGYCQPMAMFSLGQSSINHANLCGNTFDTVYSLVSTQTHLSNSFTRRSYKNGVFKNESSNAVPSINSIPDKFQYGLNIGCTGHYNFRYCSFGIKDVRIYNKVLTQEEINALL